MKLKRTSSPALEPITLQEGKDHLRVTTTGMDSVIAIEISDARAWLEKQISCQMIVCSYQGYLNAFPDTNFIEIPLYPVTGVSAVEYFAPDGVSYSTLPSSSYILDDVRKPPRIYLAPDASWPSTEARPNAVRITFVAGHASPGEVPENWRRALKLVLTNFHEHLGDEGLVTLPRTIRDMIDMDSLIHV